MTHKCTPLAKRLSMGSALGIVFGLLCFMVFASHAEIPAELSQYQNWSWSNVMMWSTITNRLALGVVVALAGFVTNHPRFGFRLHPIWRGIKVGILISLPMALGALMGENTEVAKQSFWLIIGAGAIIGAIIDVTLTKFTGEGKELTKDVC